MYWYIAKVVFNIVSGSGDHKPQFDEQYRLVKAETMEEAFQKSVQMGRNEEEIMLNSNEEIVRWDFVNVSELYPVNELRDGMELFSAIHEVEVKNNYIEVVNMKASYVQSKFEAVSIRA